MSSWRGQRRIARRNIAGAKGISLLMAKLVYVDNTVPGISRQRAARSRPHHPAVIARIEGQEDGRDRLKRPRPTRWLTAAERGLIAFLEDCGTAGDIIPGETA